MSDAGKLQLKNLSHRSLIDLVRFYVPQVSRKGVCSGVTSLLGQAVSIDDIEETHFYKRLDLLSTYLSAQETDKLIKEIEFLYKSQMSDQSKTPRKVLTPEEWDKIEIQAFCESVGMQQTPQKTGVFETFVHQGDKEILFPITAAVKQEKGLELRLMLELPKDQELMRGTMYMQRDNDHMRYILLNHNNEILKGSFELPPEIAKDALTKDSLENLKSYFTREVLKTTCIPIGIVGLNMPELNVYLDELAIALQKNNAAHPKKRGFLLLASDEHVVGMYFDALSQKWHFFDINQLSEKKEYYFEVNSAELAPIIFQSFFDQKEKNTLFSIQCIAHHPSAALLSSLQEITNARFSQSLKKLNDRGYNLFSLAVLSRGFDFLVDACLASGVDIRISTKQGLTVLMLAAIEGRLDMIKKLLKIPGIDVNTASSGGWTALVWAANEGNVDIVKALLAVPGIKINQINLGNWSALMAAARFSELEVVNLLLEHGAKVNATEDDGQTALMIAVTYGHLELVQRLLTVPGIEVNKANNNGVTALMIAASLGHLEIVKLLLAVPGIDIMKSNEMGITALDMAENNNHIAIVGLIKNLLPNKHTQQVKPDQESVEPKMLNEAFLAAIKQRSIDDLNKILDTYKFSNQFLNEALATTLEQLHNEPETRTESEKIALSILKLYDNTNSDPILDAALMKPLMQIYEGQGTRENNEKTALSILKLYKNKNSDTPFSSTLDPAMIDSILILACNHKMNEFALALLEKGYNPNNNKNVTEKSPLIYACENGLRDVVLKLIDKKVELDHVFFCDNEKSEGPEQTTPLLTALRSRYPDIASILIDAGTKNFNIPYLDKSQSEKNLHNYSALSIAIKNGYVDLAKKIHTELQKQNIVLDHYIKDIQLACYSGNLELIDLILNSNVYEQKIKLEDLIASIYPKFFYDTKYKNELRVNVITHLLDRLTVCPEKTYNLAIEFMDADVLMKIFDSKNHIPDDLTKKLTLVDKLNSAYENYPSHDKRDIYYKNTILALLEKGYINLDAIDTYIREKDPEKCQHLIEIRKTIPDKYSETLDPTLTIHYESKTKKEEDIPQKEPDSHSNKPFLPKKNDF